jgi:hypothetical protein
MKYSNFLEVNSKDNNNYPICVANIPVGDGSNITKVVHKAFFNKAEIAFIREHKHLYFISDLGTNVSVIGFRSPFVGEGCLKPVDFERFIIHKLTYKGKEFIVTLSRDVFNNKTQARWFNISLGAEWTKSGMLPGNILSKGKGWLKAVISQMTSELDSYQEKDTH